MDSLVKPEHPNRGALVIDVGRLLAVDPGEKRIGIAISDETGTLASPLEVLLHVSMTIDAAQIAGLAMENGVKTIIVGVPTGGQGEEIPQTRHAQKLIESIRSQTQIPVIGWDEWGSTKKALEILIASGRSKTKRGGHQDALAAAVILNNYIEENPGGEIQHE
jgi:putative Holliday junction resolvase